MFNGIFNNWLKGSETAESSDYYKYIVPEGSNQSIFAFVSYQGTDAMGQSTTQRHNTFGNLLDGITFDLYHPAEAIVNTGGTGTVTYTQNGSETNVEITPQSKNNPLEIMVDDNTELEIIAKPSFAMDDNGNFRLDGENRKIPNMFIGSYVTVNGERRYLKNEEFTRETDADGNDYYKYNFKNISGRVTVELFFSEIYTVTYLSNGGEKYSVKSMGSGTGISVLDDTVNVARFSEKLLSDIDKLDGTKTRPEYGYVLAKKSTAEKACENAGVTADNYELEYNGKNVNGKDTTAKTSYGYVTNVNCTSSKSYSGIVPLDHFNSDNYRIFSLVITYKKGGSSAQSQDVIARPYIRYTDANGLFRTYYSDYTGNSKLYGGCSTSFNSVKNIIAENYQKIQK